MAEAAIYVLGFEDAAAGDVAIVGGKNASLSNMVRTLRAAGLAVPDGFATTAAGFRAYIVANNIATGLQAQLAAFKAGRTPLHEAGAAIRRLFLEGEFPPEIAEAIRQAYRDLSRVAGVDELAVAVRSSATAEDLPDASFAGQQETFLNVRGERDLLDACRRCFASLFTDRAISYREAKGFDHLKIALSIGVQRMVRSDLAGSGVMFSIDTETGFPNAIVISRSALPPDHRTDLGRERAQARLRSGRQCAHGTRRHHQARTQSVRAERRRGASAGALGRTYRSALWPADGHGMGQGR